ncbi:MAG: hypothetical protein WBW62_11530 [Solirubrobacterales bacterium]
MNGPLDPKQAAAQHRQKRARRTRTIRRGVATLGTSLVIAFSVSVAQRPAGTTETVTVASTSTTSSATSTGVTTVEQPSTETTQPSDTTTTQPEQLVTSQS